MGRSYVRKSSNATLLPTDILPVKEHAKAEDDNLETDIHVRFTASGKVIPPPDPDTARERLVGAGVAFIDRLLSAKEQIIQANRLRQAARRQEAGIAAQQPSANLSRYSARFDSKNRLTYYSITLRFETMTPEQLNH